MEAEGEGGAGAVTVRRSRGCDVEPDKAGRSVNGENQFQCESYSGGVDGNRFPCESYFGGADDKRDNPGPARVARLPGLVSILLVGVNTSSRR